MLHNQYQESGKDTSERIAILQYLLLQLLMRVLVAAETSSRVSVTMPRCGQQQHQHQHRQLKLLFYQLLSMRVVW